MKLSIAAFLATMCVAPNVCGQEPLLPTIGTDAIKLKTWGWTWSTYDMTNHEGDALSMFRVRANVETDTPLGLFFELDFTKGAGTEDNWLRQGIVTYESPSGDWDVSAGRLFLASYRVTPPPFQLKTARFVRYPFDVYGWGVQLHSTPGKWDIRWDVSGDTRTHYNDGDQFAAIATTARAVYDATDTLKLGFAAQLAEESNALAAEATWRMNERTYVNGVVYVADGDRSTTGGYVLAAYKPPKFPELHAMLDYNGSARDEILASAGVRWTLFDRIDLFIDHEFNRGDSYARLQFRY